MQRTMTVIYNNRLSGLSSSLVLPPPPFPSPCLPGSIIIFMLLLMEIASLHWFFLQKKFHLNPLRSFRQYAYLKSVIS